MSLETRYHLKCDRCGMPSIAGESRNEVRERATENGWDVGPHRVQTRSGTLIHHTDYCPKCAKER